MKLLNLYQPQLFAALKLQDFARRSLSDLQFNMTLMQETAAAASSDKFWKEKTLLEFNKYLPDVIRDLSHIHQNHYELIPAQKLLIKELQKKLTEGNKNRGISVYQSYQILMNSTNIDLDTERNVQTIGWCVEILYKSLKENEKSYRKTEINDSEGFSSGHVSKMLESSLYQLLWKNYYRHPCFLHIMNLFQKVSHYGMLGQTLDYQLHKSKCLDEFDMNKYSTITKYKTSYNTFALPVLLSLYMANVTDQEVHRQAKTISLEMGHFFQTQKDYQNCYGEKVKEPSYIANGICDWLSVVALQRANAGQRKILEENYGKSEAECIDRVKELYHDLGVPTTYKIYEERSNELLCTQIQQSSRGLPHDLFFKLMDRFYTSNSI